MTVRELLERFGPTLTIIGVIALMVVVMPGGDDPGTVQAGGPGAVNGADGSGDGSGGPGGPVGTGSGGAAGTGGGDGGDGQRVGAGGGPGGGSGNGGGGQAAGGTAPPDDPDLVVGWGAEADCRPDGRQPGISRYLPPCVPRFTGDNGGATSRGVSGDQIIVTRFVAQSNPATQATLRAIGAEDPPADQERIYDVLRRYSNQHYETYGREVVFVDVPASGPNDNDEAMRADAVRIAEQIGAFANIGGPPVLLEELAQRGVIAHRTDSVSRRFFERNPPYIFTALPTIESYYEHLAEYIAKRLAGRNAVHAGDQHNPLQGFNDTERVFGLFWVEGEGDKVDPDAKPARDYFAQLLRQHGVELAADVGYQFDIARQQTQATTMISRMRSAGVTTIAMVVDPLYPIFLTTEASRQNYFPEWLVSGTLLSDTSFFGRTYDQRQWASAFGITPLWVFFENVENSSGYREYHHGAPGSAPGDEGVGINVYRGPVERLFLGFQMAGPNLTPDAYVQGMMNYPRTGGTPSSPLHYFTEREPNAYKDFTEIWWNANGSGKDELSNDGRGIMMKANGGQRYELGEWPNRESDAFRSEGAVFTTDEPEGGRPDVPHDEDGHTHDYPCRSCR